MVDEITPTYYAPGTYRLTFTLIGRGFHMIPHDALGIRANLNSQPLRYRDSNDAWDLLEVTERSANRIVLTSSVSSGYGNTFLGGIVSNDREIVYWVNESQPLPPSRGDIVDTEFIDER